MKWDEPTRTDDSIIGRLQGHGIGYRELLLIGLSLIFVLGLIFTSLFSGEPTDSPSANILALGPNAKVDGTIKIPIYQPLSMSGLSRDQIFKYRKDIVNRSNELLLNSYEPSETVFNRMEEGLPWFSMAGFYFYGPSKNSTRGPSSEGRFLLNPFLLVGAEFWGLSRWNAKGGIAWDGSKVREPELSNGAIPLTIIASSLEWKPKEMKVNVDYDVTSFFYITNQRSTVPLSPEGLIVGLSAYNARDFAFNFLSVDRQASKNVQDFDQSYNAIEITDRISAFDRLCARGIRCNHADVPNSSTDSIVLSKLPAAIAVKLWREKPNSAEDPANLLYILNFR